MPPRITAPRGTRDLLPDDAPVWTAVESLARNLSGRYGFERVEVPLFERVELWARGAGETSDVVEKQMFRVAGPRGSEEEEAPWVLRPEPTASIVRAYVEHGMHVRPGPLRLMLIGPMFRYDRPQAGRFRQFTQWDVEVIGDAGPMVDAELIELAHRFYREAHVDEVVAHVNSIGDETCRPRYREALLAYFGGQEDRLTEDSRRRLQTNPLRVLDDKDLEPEIAEGAPRSVDHLCAACREHFHAVLNALDALQLRYVVDHRLVRGLDYYTRTTYEFFVAGREGQQDALGAGGRYDGLVELLGGRSTPGIGFGLGLDRTVLALQEQGVGSGSSKPPIAVVGTGDDHVDRLRVATRLRDAELAVRVDGSSRGLGKQLEAATKHGARQAVIVGEELGRGAVLVKDLGSGEQREVSLETLAEVLGRVPDTMPPA